MCFSCRDEDETILLKSSVSGTYIKGSRVSFLLWQTQTMNLFPISKQFAHSVWIPRFMPDEEFAGSKSIANVFKVMLTLHTWFSFKKKKPRPKICVWALVKFNGKSEKKMTFKGSRRTKLSARLARFPRVVWNYYPCRSREGIFLWLFYLLPFLKRRVNNQKT